MSITLIGVSLPQSFSERKADYDWLHQATNEKEEAGIPNGEQAGRHVT